jgi:hypothetical protein
MGIGFQPSWNGVTLAAMLVLPVLLMIIFLRPQVFGDLDRFSIPAIIIAIVLTQLGADATNLLVAAPPLGRSLGHIITNDRWVGNGDWQHSWIP